MPAEAPRSILQALEDQDTTVTFDDPLEHDMVLNMGPQHPATHGVLRLLLRLDGETVVAAVPDLGYLHRGYEKIAENSTYHEFIPHTDRLDYL
ncbi:MAG TPA: NADH-quinone oxidoreductase subunit D, partial [Bacteroidota bacterium]|nr:NADH-quinone oxidoreductase subunit D [Bacteroidota bacterium]